MIHFPLTQCIHIHVPTSIRKAQCSKYLYICIYKSALDYNVNFILVHSLPKTMSTLLAVQILFVKGSHAVLFTFNDQMHHTCMHGTLVQEVCINLSKPDAL